MGEDKYTVILEFNPQDLKILNKVRGCLERLKRMSPVHLEKLLSKGKIVIKRQIDWETAKLLGNLFRDTGAICIIEKQISQASVLNPCKNQPDIERDLAYMVCPNCAKTQLLSPECRFCGIIVARTKSRQISGNNGKETVAVESDLSHLFETWCEPQDDCDQPATPNFLKWLWTPFKIVDIRRWTKRARSALSRCWLTFIVALGLEVGLLYVYRSLWSLYKLTPIGQLFVTNPLNEADIIERVLKLDPIVLGLRVTLLVLMALIALGFATQFLCLIRYFYESRGIFGKLLLWFVPAIAGTAWILSKQEPWPHYEMACVLTAPLVFCLLSSCFYLARVVMPEFRELLGEVAIIFSAVNQARGKISCWLGIQSKNQQANADSAFDDFSE